MVFIGPFEHHSNELPWRESIADVVTIHEDADGHIDLADLRGAAARVPRPAAADRLVQRREQRDRHRHRHPSRVAAAPRARRARLLGLRGRRALRRHRDEPAVRRAPARVQGRDLPVAPQVHRRPGHARRAHRAAGAAHQHACPTSSAAAPSRTSTPRSTSTSTDPVHREEGGTPAIIESIRAGLVFQLKEAVGHRRDPRARGGLRPPRDRGVDRATRPSQVLGNLEAERLSIVSFVINRPGGRYLHHNLVVAILNDLFGIQSRGGCSCAGPYGHRLLGHRPRALARVRARDLPRLRGHQARLGARELQLLRLGGGLRVHRRRRWSSSPTTAGA